MFKKLKTKCLKDALRAMEVGEICIAPDGYAAKTVVKTCSELKDDGYLFVTSLRSGEQTILRLK